MAQDGAAINMALPEPLLEMIRKFSERNERYFPEQWSWGVDEFFFEIFQEAAKYPKDVQSILDAYVADNVVSTLYPSKKATREPMTFCLYGAQCSRTLKRMLDRGFRPQFDKNSLDADATAAMHVLRASDEFSGILAAHPNTVVEDVVKLAIWGHSASLNNMRVECRDVWLLRSDPRATELLDMYFTRNPMVNIGEYNELACTALIMGASDAVLDSFARQLQSITLITSYIKAHITLLLIARGRYDLVPDDFSGCTCTCAGQLIPFVSKLTSMVDHKLITGRLSSVDDIVTICNLKAVKHYAILDPRGYGDVHDFFAHCLYKHLAKASRELEFLSIIHGLLTPSTTVCFPYPGVSLRALHELVLLDVDAKIPKIVGNPTLMATLLNYALPESETGRMCLNFVETRTTAVEMLTVTIPPIKPNGYDRSQMRLVLKTLNVWMHQIKHKWHDVDWWLQVFAYTTRGHLDAGWIILQLWRKLGLESAVVSQWPLETLCCPKTYDEHQYVSALLAMEIACRSPEARVPPNLVNVIIRNCKRDSPDWFEYASGILSIVLHFAHDKIVLEPNTFEQLLNLWSTGFFQTIRCWRRDDAWSYCRGFLDLIRLRPDFRLPPHLSLIKVNAAVREKLPLSTLTKPRFFSFKFPKYKVDHFDTSSCEVSEFIGKTARSRCVWSILKWRRCVVGRSQLGPSDEFVPSKSFVRSIVRPVYVSPISRSTWHPSWKRPDVELDLTGLECD